MGEDKLTVTIKKKNQPPANPDAILGPAKPAPEEVQSTDGAVKMRMHVMEHVAPDPRGSKPKSMSETPIQGRG